MDAPTQEQEEFRDVKMRGLQTDYYFIPRANNFKNPKYHMLKPK